MLKIFKNINAQRHEERKAELYRNLIRHEARIGGQVFGAVPKGHRREFFCLDEHTWVWHEEWTDNNGQTRVQTTRYDVRPNGIIKSQGGHLQPVGDREAARLYQAAKNYRERIQREMYAFAG